MVAFQGCGIFFPWGMTLGENPKMRLSNSNCIGVERAVSTRCFLLVWLCNGRAMCELLLFIAHRHAFQKANQPFTLERRISCNSSFFSPNKFARDVIYILLLCARERYCVGSCLNRCVRVWSVKSCWPHLRKWLSCPPSQKRKWPTWKREIGNYLSPVNSQASLSVLKACN